MNIKALNMLKITVNTLLLNVDTFFREKGKLKYGTEKIYNRRRLPN